ncbi:MAG: hypothetical protein GOMPHAMPRED_006007 [Gomphillus americanus]|uniref:Uncharacterized protein n=1 Tax=Gomphillus americanus TaxID=1940652 RepID=A0A8H3I7J1_9LECA|nr:MAG: hypothetical protein GOMPHAMPRED_006007 [Gomphillus americanus]
MSVSFNSGALAWIIVLPIAFAVGVALMTWTVVRRWKRDAAAPPDQLFYYPTEPGITLEERVKRIHEARELAQQRKNGTLPSGTALPPPAYVPSPAYVA